jgi:Na+/H+ antiporter NhaD/arsenite permease-like protein
MLIKILIVIAMLIILFSLFRSLFFLTTEKQDSKRTVINLKWRIGLSILLFILIVVGIVTGVIEPHGLPTVTKPE